MAGVGTVSMEEVELACGSGNVEGLYALLSQEQDLVGVVNVTYGDGVTLLMKTIIGAGSEGADPQGRYADCCVLLLQGGAEVETADTTYGRTAAHWAVYYQREDILTVLLEAGCDMTCLDYEGTSPFHLCLQARATNCLLVSLQVLPADILRVPHPQFLLPLHHAVAMDDRDTCEILVNAGANVNEVDEGTKKSALHVAAENDTKSLVEFLLACGAHLDVIDGRGLTPLHIASIVEGGQGLEAIVKRVGGGEVLDLRDDKGLTPLMYACQNGNAPSVRTLVRKKADVAVLDGEGRNCLHYAAESSSQTAHECVQLLLRKHKSLLEVKDGEGRGMIHLCAASGTDQTLSVLLTAGCQLETRDENQRTPLHWTALNGNSVVMATLLEAGAEVDAVDTQGSTPLHLACQHSLLHSDEVYTDEVEVREQLIQQCVELLLRGGASTTAMDGLGRGPIHYAVQTHTNLPVVTLLLQFGADIAARTANEKMTALHIAASGSFSESCKYLLEVSGGELGNIEDNNGQTALHTVVEGVALGGVAMPQVLVCMELLLQAGLQADQPDSEMRTPAHIAASYGLVECLQLLNQYGANLSMPSVDGATPLHEAAASGQAGVLQFLLALEGVSIDTGAGRSKATSLHYAVQSGHLESVQVLLQYGADVNCLTLTEDGEYLSPLDLCQEGGSLQDLLLQSNALSGTELSKSQTKFAEEPHSPETQKEGDRKKLVEEADEKKETSGEGRMEVVPEEPISIPSRQPSATPSRRSFTGVPEFDEEKWAGPSSSHPSRLPASKSPPLLSHDSRKQGLGVLKKAFKLMGKKKKVEREDEPAMASAVGFFSSQATMLVAAVVGTFLGDRARRVAEKVALGTASELRKSAAEHEGEVQPLIWPVEEVDAPATPPPSPPTPTPTPPPPPPPQEQEDPMERRLRRARAQLDMRKSAGLLALEELLKAQDTQMKLNRQFQRDKMKNLARRRREEFKAAEAREVALEEKSRRKLLKRMEKAESESEHVKQQIEEELGKASRENQHVAGLMTEMGVNPRPTIAQWLQRKQHQKKAELQESLITWDRDRKRREAAILVEQTILTHRATKHVVWGAKKDLSTQIRALKSSPLKESLVRPAQHHSGPQGASGRAKSPAEPAKKVKQSRRIFPPPSLSGRKTRPSNRVAPMVESHVRPTPGGFRKVITNITPGERRVLPEADEPDLWTKGQTYATSGKLSLTTPFTSSPTYLRATGPKTVHADRTLHFLPPAEYKAVRTADRSNMKKLSQQFRSSSVAGGDGERSKPPRKSSLVVHSMDFQQEKISRKALQQDKSSSMGGARYHSLSDSISGRSQKHKTAQPTAAPILNMSVISTPRGHSQMTTIT